MKFHAHKISGLFSLILVAAVCLMLAACSSWERTTYQTLAATKATIDQAAADYRAAKIPQTQETYVLITKARAADALAVEAFGAYASLKVGGGSSSALINAQNKVVALMAALAASLKPLEALLGQEAQTNAAVYRMQPRPNPPRAAIARWAV